jgi:AraC-like DNA-binding protein
VTAKAVEQFDPADAASLPGAGEKLSGPTLSVRFLRALPDVMRQLGLDTAQTLQHAGLDPDTFADADRRLTFAEVERLLAACEHRSQADHVGLLLGRHPRLHDLGLAANVALCSATVGDGLRNLVEHCNLYDTPATARLTVHGDRARFAWRLDEHCLVDARQFDFASLAISANLLHDLMAPGWQPRAVRSSSRPPAADALFRSQFGMPVEFSAEHSEIEFDAVVLEERLPALGPSARAAIAAELQQARIALLADLPATLRRILHKRLLVGDFSMDDVAAQLSMHRRTLDRRLQRFATTYGELLEAVRDDIARQLLRETHFSIQRIAEAVRFSSAANFATAFRRRTGMTPTEFRRAG